jgi:hypothetical protein
VLPHDRARVVPAVPEQVGLDDLDPAAQEIETVGRPAWRSPKVSVPLADSRARLEAMDSNSV